MGVPVGVLSGYVVAAGACHSSIFEGVSAADVKRLNSLNNDDGGERKMKESRDKMETADEHFSIYISCCSQTVGLINRGKNLRPLKPKRTHKTTISSNASISCLDGQIWGYAEQLAVIVTDRLI